MTLCPSFYGFTTRSFYVRPAFRATRNYTMAGERGVKRSNREQDISPPPLKRKADSSVTSKSAIDFFKPTSQKKPEKITWRIVNNSCIIGRYHAEEGGTWNDKLQETKDGGKRRIAAFDLDHTLIATKSGNRFPRDGNDWKWWNAAVPKKVWELHSQGYSVAVVSNQRAISLRKDLKGGKSESKSYTMFKQKVTAVMQALDIPLSVYAATENDEYRKPRMGMWKEFLDDYDLDIENSIDLGASLFVGDAAGRSGDHSCADRDLAANIGIPFKTPEEFFLGQPPEAITRTFDPKAFVNQTAAEDTQTPFSRLSDIELVIFCGSPSAGKSTFYWKYLEPLGYERVNQDILKTRPKCLKVANELLSGGKSVAVDNTNADPETRAHWTNLAKDLKVPIRCIYITTSAEISKHNNAVRAANSKVESINPESRSLLPGIAFGDFTRRFREPTLSEGFQDITRIDFQFQGTSAEKETWGQYWV